MVKKVIISKRSRAARRGLVVEGPEAAALASLPKEHDVTASMIRTTIKNEELLNRKMMKKDTSAIRKQKLLLSKAEKLKQERALKIDGILSNKIEQSRDRARKIQITRKSGWEKINQQIRSELNPSLLLNIDKEPEKTEEQLAKEEEDAMVAEFFKKDGEGESQKETAIKESKSSQNVFDLLTEAEA